MKKKISSKDLELLSAYIDGELKSRQRIQLQARLHEEPLLDKTLLNLQQTKKILQAAPKLKSPRNFTLTSEMVGESRASLKQFFRFRMVTAVASFLLILVLVGDYLSVPGQLRSAADIPQVTLIQEEKEPDLPLMEAQEVEAPAEMMAESGEWAPSDDLSKTAPGEEIEEPGETGYAPFILEESESIISENIPAGEEEMAEGIPDDRHITDRVESDIATEITATPLLLEAPVLEKPTVTQSEFDQGEISPTASGEMNQQSLGSEKELDEESDQVDQPARETKEKDVWKSIKSTNRWIFRVIEGVLGLIVVAGSILALYFWKVSRDVS